MHIFNGTVVDLMSRRTERTPYKIQAKGKIGEVFLYDVIGDSWEGTTAKAFADDMKKMGAMDELHIFINSPGGSVFDGTSIYNIIKRNSARKIVNIDGLAASIASLIAMSGDEIRIAANGMMMIHDPWSLAIGTAADLRKTADTLDQVRDSILGTYVARTGGKRDAISDMMSEETWMTAEQAVELGFADTTVEAVDVAALAKFDLSDFKKVPETLAEAREAAPEPFEPTPHPALAKMDNRLRKRGIRQGRPCEPTTPAA